MLESGTVLGSRYEILNVFSQGGRLVIYRARDLQTGSLCTLKVLEIPNNIDMKRFHREAFLMSKMDHPGICRLLDCNLDERSLPFIVMEYFDGVDLETHLVSEGPQPAEWALPVFAQICDALAAAHELEVIHRNIKPSKVILCGNMSRPQVKLYDFGFAKPLLNENNPMMDFTDAGIAVGTLPYMSPELTRGVPADQQSDIYALGCLMYRTFTGKNPYEARSLPDLIKKHQEKTPPAISKANPSMRVPEHVEKAVFKAMELNPKSRFQSVKDLRSAIISSVTAGRRTIPTSVVTIAIIVCVLLGGIVFALTGLKH